ncbi:MAG: BatA and WFA domain-containing protein [Bacteroidales bacterium]|nr:BatA and WFA domain-containing protein [Bacteroidales bacterium]
MIFTYPLFLIGLVAMAIPVIVHLFNFRRYKKIFFSNVEKLEEMQSETRRQSTLRQILIMVARMLAIAFLALAFAQPVIKRSDKTIRAGRNDVAIFIDNSYSMQNIDGNGPMIEKAKAKAREIVAAFGEGDRFHLMTCDVEGRHFHWLSRDEMLTMIDEVEPGSASPSLSSMIERQRDFVRGGNGEHKEIFVISDFQTSVADIDNFVNDSAIAVTLVPLKPSELDNVYVDSVALGAPVYYRGNTVETEVWIRNDGSENIEGVPVTLYVNGRQRAVATVDLPAEGRTALMMPFTVDATGVLDCRVECSDYPVVFDDSYYFTLNIREYIQGLVVEGGAANVFLTRLFEGDSAVKMQTMNVQQMDFSRVDGNDVVILDELTSLSSGMVQSLRTFLDGGGTVVVVVSDKADKESYNSALMQFGAPSLEQQHRGRVAAGTVSMDNALYRNVFNGRNSDMELPSVNDYWRLTTSSSTIYEPIITLSNGDVYVSVTSCGPGRIYLVAAPLRDEHTDFVRQALFVPTLYNMALYSVRPSLPAVSLGGNTPVPLSQRYDGLENIHLVSAQSSIGSKDSNAAIFDVIADIRVVGGVSNLVPHSNLHEAGNYWLQSDGKTIEGVSFNYSRLESQMSFLERSQISSMLKDYNLDNISVVDNVDKPLDSYLKERMDGKQLWRWCLVLSLLMLLAEILLIRIPKKNKVKSDERAS